MLGLNDLDFLPILRRSIFCAEKTFNVGKLVCASQAVVKYFLIL